MPLSLSSSSSSSILLSSSMSSMSMGMSYSISSPVLKMYSVINHKEKFPRKIRIAINEEIIIRKEYINAYKNNNNNNNNNNSRASSSSSSTSSSSSLSNARKPRRGGHNKIKKMKDNINTDTAVIFLNNIYSKIIDFLFANNSYSYSYSNNDISPTTSSSTDHRGLNNDYDTEMEVEIMIRFFPNCIKEKRNGNGNGNGNGNVGRYCIMCQATNFRGEFNIKSIPFLPIMAELGIELGMGEFALRKEKELRGGLIGGTTTTTRSAVSNNNMIRLLVTNDCITNKFKTDNDDNNDNNDDNNEKEHYHNRIDEICLDVIKQLRKKNLFHKEDIKKYKLLDILCSQGDYFPERRFKYLVDWDPDSLLSGRGCTRCPLHYSAASTTSTNTNTTTTTTRSSSRSSCSSIRGFQIVFETGIQYFPIQFGFLFHKDNGSNNNNGCGRTSYQLACNKYGKMKIDMIIDDIIITTRTTMNNDSNNNSNNNNNNNATTANTNQVVRGGAGGTGDDCSIDNTMMMKALIFAATEDNISLEGVYFFVRREPNICSF